MKVNPPTIYGQFKSVETHAVVPNKIPAQMEHHDKAGIYERVMPSATFELSDAETKYAESDTAAVRDKAIECWVRWLAKEMGIEVTDEYVQYCIDSWHGFWG